MAPFKTKLVTNMLSRECRFPLEVRDGSSSAHPEFPIWAPSSRILTLLRPQTQEFHDHGNPHRGIGAPTAPRRNTRSCSAARPTAPRIDQPLFKNSPQRTPSELPSAKAHQFTHRFFPQRLLLPHPR